MTVNRFAGQVFTPAEISTDTPRYDALGNMTMENRSDEKVQGYLGQANIADAGFKGIERIAQANVEAARTEANATIGAAQMQAGGISDAASGIAGGIGSMSFGGGSSGGGGLVSGNIYNPSNLNFTPAAGAWG